MAQKSSAPAQILDFLGKDVVLQMGLGFLVGTTLFLSDLAFAYGLQAFLLTLGLAREGALLVPAWVPQDKILGVVAFIFTAALVRGAMQWSQDYLANSVTERFRFTQRKRILSQVLHSRSASTSMSMSLFTEWTTVASNAVSGLQAAAVLLSSGALLCMGLMRISVSITLVAVVFLVLFGLPLRALNRKVRVSGTRVGAEWESACARLVLSIRNLLLLRIYGMEEAEEREGHASLQRFMAHTMTFRFISGFLFAFPQILGVFIICTIAIAAKSYALLAPGLLISYFYLFIRFVQTGSAVAGALSTVSFSWAPLRKIYDWWQAAERGSLAIPAMIEAEGAELMDAGPLGWELNRVTFRYGSGQVPILSGLTERIEPGSAFVVVGPSGAGKSTLLSLLLGELVPETGSVKVLSARGARPLSEVRSAFLKRIGYVGAEPFLVEGTIRENLRYGLRRAPDEPEMDRALQMAECGFVRELPLGLDHRITEQGQGLSAGQKQRISLARALLRDPAALILDEATANLDADTEEKLVKTFSQLKGKLTLIAVTHRTALLAIADRQLRLEVPRVL